MNVSPSALAWQSLLLVAKKRNPDVYRVARISFIIAFMLPFIYFWSDYLLTGFRETDNVNTTCDKRPGCNMGLPFTDVYRTGYSLLWVFGVMMALSLVCTLLDSFLGRKVDRVCRSLEGLDEQGGFELSNKMIEQFGENPDFNVLYDSPRFNEIVGSFFWHGKVL